MAEILSSTMRYLVAFFIGKSAVSELLATTSTTKSSTFDLSHRWLYPGGYTLRAEFPGDGRNVESASDDVTLIVQQREHPSFTITTSEPVISEGSSVTISGVLYRPGSTSIVEPPTQVTLYGQQMGGALKAIVTTVTGSDGSYSFTETPSHNELFRAEMTLNPHRATSDLYQGVQDMVSLGASSRTAELGGTVTCSGTISPDKSGHLIYLQRLGADGYWHNALSGVVGASSAYSFSYTFGDLGDVELRARIYGGPDNIGSASSPIFVEVSGLVSVTSLPPAS